MSKMKVIDERKCKLVPLNELCWGEWFMDNEGNLQQVVIGGDSQERSGNLKRRIHDPRNPCPSLVADVRDLVTPVNVEIHIVD